MSAFLTPDYLDEEEFEQWLAAHEDDVGLPSSTIDDSIQTTLDPSSSRQRDGTKTNSGPCAFLDYVEHGNLYLQRNTTVELDDGSFLVITDIAQYARSGNVFLRGETLLRTNNENLQLADKINEVCWIYQSTQPGDIRSHVIKEVSVSRIVRCRLLRRTNRLWPELSLEEDPHWSKRKKTISFEFHRPETQAWEEGVLVCRVKHIECYRNGKWHERGFYALTEAECDQDGESYLPAEHLRSKWRGHTTKGGSCDHWQRGEKEFLRQEQVCNSGKPCYQSLESASHKWPIDDAMNRRYVGDLITEEDILEADLESAEDLSHPTKPLNQQSREGVDTSPRKKSQRYTLGDAFCGAGGAARGATMAGLRISWGFDFDIGACETYLRNNFGTKVYHLWCDRFSGLPHRYFLRVDVLHLSPTCKFWSPAHTREGKDDEQNIATLFALESLMKRTRPRIVTMEQTAGLLRTVHRPYFNAVIRWFTEHGFQVHWRVLQCADFGVPQSRPRLFIIAACPGETLPPFPEPTHQRKGGGSNLRPWTTINSAIADIPEDWHNHDLSLMDRSRERSAAGETHASCICTSGGLLHPSGKRNMTDRELACVQTFPLGHKFADVGTTATKVQIGNAVPPLMAKIVFESVKHSLMKADGVLG